jgi:16S rRNA processing protein RimM
LRKGSLEAILIHPQLGMKSSEPEFITIGQILAPWGIKGKLKVEVVTDFPQRFTPSSKVYINRQPMTINSTEWHKGKAIIKLSTIDSIEDAQRLRGQPVEIHHSQTYPLSEGQYYHFQLIGLEVWTTQGELLGTVTDVLAADSNDNYVVRGAKGETLIPAIEDVIKSIDLSKGCIVIEPIEGLLSLNKK